jgi:hypothetical protein
MNKLKLEIVKKLEILLHPQSYALLGLNITFSTVVKK